MEILTKALIIGESIVDHSIGETVVVSSRNIKQFVFGIVNYTNKNFIYGFFSWKPTENILFEIDEGSNAVWVISKDIFGDNIIFSRKTGLYRIRNSKDPSGPISPRMGSGGFPYSISREYESLGHIESFNYKNSYNELFNPKYKNLIKYTFGVEYETSCGYIPQELCYRHGLIPLRDGSISGIEYASTVMDSSDGLEKIVSHLNLLKEYTSFNKECSYHIHLGGFPVNHKYIYTLYNVWSCISDELKDYLPRYAFNTSAYKNSRKDYCKLNPALFKNFEEMYLYLSGRNANYAGSLMQPHPQDPEKRAKWNIKERYWAQSLIGMCFYDKPKTVEYRMLSPTYNSNKLIFWLYMFNAILLYSEKIALDVYRTKSPIYSIYKNTISIEQMLHDVYPDEFALKMLQVMDKVREVVTTQSAMGDYIGEEINIEESVIKEGVV